MMPCLIIIRSNMATGVGIGPLPKARTSLTRRCPILRAKRKYSARSEYYRFWSQPLGTIDGLFALALNLKTFGLGDGFGWIASGRADHGRSGSLPFASVLALVPWKACMRPI